jgi:hypothetical protein
MALYPSSCFEGIVSLHSFDLQGCNTCFRRENGPVQLLTQWWKRSMIVVLELLTVMSRGEKPKVEYRSGSIIRRPLSGNGVSR